MQDCVFCQIVAGTSPSYRVYEDQDFFGFLDIYPRSKGHTLIIPKKHYQWIYDVPQFSDYWEVVLKVTKALQRVLQTNWITYFTYGAIPHAHIHILPRNDTINMQPQEMQIVPPHINFNKNEMGQLAEEIYETVKK